MASFTDNPQLLANFNPYVQQLPVDAMREVGMYKQGKYDEGVQKIQTSIDNVAGLDIIRDVDKGYLQSKLNTLGNSLKTVAAGDFSNFQLVNSTAGMANSISKDDSIQNAVMSTAKYRKGLKEMEAANKEGKGAASHDWLFKTDANDWFKSQDVNKSFDSGYKQYSNYSKNAQEVIKALVKNSTDQDVAFDKDENGNMVVLDAMTRTKIAGITPERIQSALMVGLSANDFQSMQIDGRYNYSNSTPEQFINDVNKSYKKNYDELKLQRDMTFNAIDSTSSASAKIQLTKQVESFDKSLKNLSTEYGSVSKTFAEGDVESAKARLHTAKWINNFAQTFSSQDVSQNYVASPYIQVQQYKETKALDYKKWLASYNQAQQFHADSEKWNARTDARATAKDLREAADSKSLSDYGAIPFSVDQNELPEITLDRITSQIQKDGSTISREEKNIMEQFNHAGDTLWLDQQRAKWQANSKNVEPLVAQHFNKTEPLKRESVANIIMINDINKSLDSRFGKIEDRIPTGSKPVTVNFPSGSYTYSPKDFVQFNDKFKNYIKPTGSVGSGKGFSNLIYDDAKAKLELSPKEYYLYQSSKNPQGNAQKVLVDNLKNYNTTVNKPFADVLSQRNDELATIIKERVVAMQGVAYGIPLNNESQKTSFGNSLLGIAKLSDTQDGGLANSPGYSSEELKAIAPDIQNAIVEVVEGTVYAPEKYRLTVGSKDKSQTFVISSEVYNSVFQGRFNSDPEISAIRDLQSQQIRTGNKTTALDGKKTNINNSYLGRNLNFVNVQNYGISGNLVTTDDGLNQLRINITDPKTNKVIIEDLGYPNFLLNANKVNSAIKGLTDAKIFEMLNNRSATAKELKELNDASQKPY